jgi:hypothetical protein
MKKLLSIAFVMAAMMFVTSSADAQTWRNGPNNRAGQQKQKQNRGNAVVRTHTETKMVRLNGKIYRETYEIKTFRNGRTTSKMISRVEVRNRRGNRQHGQQSAKTYFVTDTIREGRQNYRVTFKITEYRNGEIDTDIVSKVRV